jgi:hypothetical protein
VGIADLQRALDESVRTLGNDHSRTLVLRRDLAKAHYDARDFVSALDQHEQILADVARIVGPDDRLTVSLLGDLAHIWFAGWIADNHAELAIPLFELAVAEHIRVMGATDPGTLTARNDLATTYLAAGQLPRALAAFDHPSPTACTSWAKTTR